MLFGSKLMFDILNSFAVLEVKDFVFGHLFKSLLIILVPFIIGFWVYIFHCGELWFRFVVVLSSLLVDLMSFIFVNIFGFFGFNFISFGKKTLLVRNLMTWSVTGAELHSGFFGSSSVLFGFSDWNLSLDFLLMGILLYELSRLCINLLHFGNNLQIVLNCELVV